MLRGNRVGCISHRIVAGGRSLTLIQAVLGGAVKIVISSKAEGHRVGRVALHHPAICTRRNMGRRSR